MAIININGSEGEFPAQKVSLMLGSLALTTADGGQKVYTVSNCIKSLTIVSEHKDNVIFDVTLSDNARFRGDTNKETVHTLLKCVNATATALPKMISKEQVQKANFQGGMVIVGVVIVLFALYQCSSDAPDSPPTSRTSTQTTDVVGDAYKLCEALEGTGLTTSCEVKGFAGTVDVRIDTTGAEARKMCTAMTEMLSQKTSSFRGDRWKLQIFSPYSGEQPIAVCKLY